MQYKPRWAGLLQVALLLDLLINLALLTLRPQLFLVEQFEAEDIASAPVHVNALVNTPFLPRSPTPSLPAAVNPSPTSTAIPAPVMVFHGVDFSPGAPPIRISIQPPSDKVNRGRPITILVNPAQVCRYQDHTACTRAYRDRELRNTVFVTVHSGIGGEAESYRRAIEGLGIDQAAFSLKLVQSNLARLEGAAVQMRQGGLTVDGLQLTGVGRIPARLMRDYLHSPVEQIMPLAMKANPDLTSSARQDAPMLVFETCGWKHPEELWAPGVASASGSIYLSLVQLAR